MVGTGVLQRNGNWLVLLRISCISQCYVLLAAVTSPRCPTLSTPSGGLRDRSKRGGGGGGFEEDWVGYSLEVGVVL